MSHTTASCALCAGDGGALIWRDDTLRVIRVDEPDLPGYTRVVWNAHVPEITNLESRQRDTLMAAVYRVESVQRRVLQPDKINLASLGNMTPHLHWHVIPRWRGDPWFPESSWAARQPRDAAAAGRWREQEQAIQALQDDYETALRTALESL